MLPVDDWETTKPSVQHLTRLSHESFLCRETHQYRSNSALCLPYLLAQSSSAGKAGLFGRKDRAQTRAPLPHAGQTMTAFSPGPTTLVRILVSQHHKLPTNDERASFATHYPTGQLVSVR